MYGLATDKPMNSFDAPTEEMAAFFQGVGTVVVTWAIIEQSLDLCALELHRQGGKSFHPRIPQGLKAKTKFIKKCFDRCTKFAPVSELVGKFVSELEELSEERHNFIHSAVSRYCHQTGKITSNRMINHGTHMDPKEVEFDPNEYPALLRRLMDLSSLGHSATNAVHDLAESLLAAQSK